MPPITVSKRINILKEEFQKNTMKSLELEETYLKNTKENLRREENSRFKIKTAIDMYNKHILSIERRVDSIKQLQFTSRYDNISPNIVLLQPIECRYSFIFPGGNPRQERTDIFYFLPDYSKIT